tara:strand:- start:3459 stop:3620 length:162 start_codon:yes stop_codon:yes gene_type:complete
MKRTELFKCKVRLEDCAYSFDWYDLPTNNEDKILKWLINEGFDVLEIYDIKPQ